MALKYSVTHNGNTWNSTTDLSSIPISNGSVTDSITTAGTRTLNCAGKVASNNIVIGTKTLNCAGKIMSGNVVITATESTKYKFYTSSYTQITDISISGLENAYYYTYNDGSYQRVGGRIFYINPDAVEGTDDKFYVYDNTNGLASDMEWGAFDTSVGITSDGIGLGKTNTATALANSACFMSEHSQFITIWKYLRDTINANNVGGCNDWFIGSKAEQDKLRTSGLVNWYNSRWIWSSVEFKGNNEFAYLWVLNSPNWEWDYVLKSFPEIVCPFRSF